MLKFLGLIVAFVLNLFTVVMLGWVLTFYWVWFLMPVFQLPAISTSTAIGLMLTISFIKSYSKATEDLDQNKPDKPLADILIKRVLSSTTIMIGALLSLAVAWCWHVSM